MKSKAVPLTILSTLLMCMTGSAQETPAIEEVPLHQQLYEEGFYDSAIALLDSLIAADSAGGRELLRRLAFCHIARGDRERGAAVFERMLDRDPDSLLDTLLTPPKILEVFDAVRERRDAVRRASDSLPAANAEPAGGAPRTGTADNRTDTVAPAARLATPEGPPLLVKYSPGLLPGGAGQFYHRQRIKGFLLLTAQAAALAGCVWSYRTRQTYYDDRYGWIQGNMTAYNRYTGYTRLGSVVFIGAYTFSVIDYFSVMHKKRTSPGRR